MAFLPAAIEHCSVRDSPSQPASKSLTPDLDAQRGHRQASCDSDANEHNITYTLECTHARAATYGRIARFIYAMANFMTIHFPAASAKCERATPRRKCRINTLDALSGAHRGRGRAKNASTQNARREASRIGIGPQDDKVTNAARPELCVFGEGGTSSSSDILVGCDGCQIFQ